MLADYISKKAEQTNIKNLSSQVEKLDAIVTSLKSYIEKIIKKTNPDDYESIIFQEEKKILSAIQKQFSEEIMVHFLTQELETTSDFLFNEFKNSDSLDEVIKRSKNKALKETYDKYQTEMESDYKEIKEKYFKNI